MKAITMAGPRKLHVNNLPTRDILMSFVNRTLLTSVSKFTYITNRRLVSVKTLPVSEVLSSPYLISQRTGSRLLSSIKLPRPPNPVVTPSTETHLDEYKHGTEAIFSSRRSTTSSTRSSGINTRCNRTPFHLALLAHSSKLHVLAVC